MNDRKKALQILRKYENRPTGYDEDEIINAMIEFSETQSKLKNNGDLGDVVPSACSNCKELMNTECACLRNKCVRCLESVGNITFTVCDDCWDKEPTPQH